MTFSIGEASSIPELLQPVRSASMPDGLRN